MICRRSCVIFKKGSSSSGWKQITHARQIKPNFHTSEAYSLVLQDGRTWLWEFFLLPRFVSFSAFTAHLRCCCNKQAKKQNGDSYLTPAALGLCQPKVAAWDTGAQALLFTHSAPGQRRKGLTCHPSTRPRVRLTPTKSCSQNKGLQEMNN